MDIGFLDVAASEFYETGGFLCLKQGGEDKGRIAVRRVLPLKEPDRYLSVADAENKEIGILRDIAELSQAQRALVERELSTRYYCPEVRAIAAVKEKMGYVYLDLALDTQNRSVAVKDVSKNIRLSADGRLFVVDVDGNRYVVSRISALDSASLRRIEPYMF
jgi:hypothetical protein